MDTWQPLRMFFVWPSIVAALAWWLSFLGLERTGSWPRRNGTMALIIAATAGLTAASISRGWDDSGTYWLMFTIGLIGAAFTMWASVAYAMART